MDKITLLYVLIWVLAFLLLLVSMWLWWQAQMIKDLKWDLAYLNNELVIRIDSLDMHTWLITKALRIIGDKVFNQSNIQDKLEKLCR